MLNKSTHQSSVNILVHGDLMKLLRTFINHWFYKNGTPIVTSYIDEELCMRLNYISIEKVY